jgi:hypothetical protein
VITLAAALVIIIICLAARPLLPRWLPSWSSELALVIGSYHAQLASPEPILFSVVVGAVCDMRDDDGLCTVVVVSEAWGIERLRLPVGPDAFAATWLRAWQTEGTPIAVIHHVDGLVELYGPEGTVPVVPT